MLKVIHDFGTHDVLRRHDILQIEAERLLKNVPLGLSIFFCDRDEVVGKSPLAPQTLSVGTHALRVTHPEYRDFVRFVDVEFDTPAAVKVDHQTTTPAIASRGPTLSPNQPPGIWNSA